MGAQRRFRIRFGEDAPAELAATAKAKWLRLREVSVAADTDVEALKTVVATSCGMPEGWVVELCAGGGRALCSRTPVSAVGGGSVPLLDARVARYDAGSDATPQQQFEPREGTPPRVSRRALAKPVSRSNSSQPEDDCSAMCVEASPARSMVDYPMSDSDDDHGDKRKCKEWLVPEWARAINLECVTESVRAQEHVDVAAIFGPQIMRTCDLTKIFGYPVPTSAQRKRRPPVRSFDDDDDDVKPAPAKRRAPSCSDDEIEITCVTVTDLTPDDAPVIPAGTQYVVFMRDVDSFRNLRRHYGKHHFVPQERLVLRLHDPEAPEIEDYDDTPMTVGLISVCTVYIDVAQVRPVPRISGTSTKDDDDDDDF